MDLPQRKPDLIIEWLGDEALIYSDEHAKAFCLNPLCSKIFQLCDGQHSVRAMAKTLTGDSKQREAAVLESLTVLQEHGLLQSLPKLRRRELLKASALIPVVLAVAAPLPAAAQSAGGGGPSGTCITNTACNTGPFGCNPCDQTNGTPAVCPPNQFCMKLMALSRAANGLDVAPGTTCANDSEIVGFRNCEPENPVTGIWHRNCTFARAQAVARQLPGQAVDNYKCCFCP